MFPWVGEGWRGGCGRATTLRVVWRAEAEGAQWLTGVNRSQIKRGEILVDWQARVLLIERLESPHPAGAVGAAIAAVIISPLLALSYFGIPDGEGSLEQGSIAAWADPARTHLSGLLTWASPDRVYATYVQALGLLFPAVLL